MESGSLIQKLLLSSEMPRKAAGMVGVSLSDDEETVAKQEEVEKEERKATARGSTEDDREQAQKRWSDEELEDDERRNDVLEGLMGAREKMLEVRNGMQETVGSLIVGKAQYLNDLVVRKCQAQKNLATEKKLAMEDIQIRYFKELNDVHVKYVRETIALEERHGKRQIVEDGDFTIQGNAATAALDARIWDEMERSGINKMAISEELTAIGMSRNKEEAFFDGNLGGYSDDPKYRNHPMEMRTLVENGIDSNQNFQEEHFRTIGRMAKSVSERELARESNHHRVRKEDHDVWTARRLEIDIPGIRKKAAHLKRRVEVDDQGNRGRRGSEEEGRKRTRARDDTRNRNVEAEEMSPRLPSRSPPAHLRGSSSAGNEDPPQAGGRYEGKNTRPVHLRTDYAPQHEVSQEGRNAGCRVLQLGTEKWEQSEWFDTVDSTTMERGTYECAGGKWSYVCGLLGGICPSDSRMGLLNECRKYGDVIGFQVCFDVHEMEKWNYSGTGYVQYRYAHQLELAKRMLFIDKGPDRKKSLKITNCWREMAIQRHTGKAIQNNHKGMCPMPRISLLEDPDIMDTGIGLWGVPRTEWPLPFQ